MIQFCHFGTREERQWPPFCATPCPAVEERRRGRRRRTSCTSAIAVLSFLVTSTTNRSPPSLHFAAGSTCPPTAGAFVSEAPLRGRRKIDDDNIHCSTIDTIRGRIRRNNVLWHTWNLSSTRSLSNRSSGIRTVNNRSHLTAKMNKSTSMMDHHQHSTESLSQGTSKLDRLLDKYHLMEKVERLTITKKSSKDTNSNDSNFIEYVPTKTRRDYIAEVHHNGKLHFGVLKSFCWKTTKSKRQSTENGDLGDESIIPTSGEPRVMVELFITEKDDVAHGKMTTTMTVVDVGQITDLWEVTPNISSHLQEIEQQQQQTRATNTINEQEELQILYDSLRGRGRKQNDISLTKKQIAKLADGNERMAQLLRRAMIEPRTIISNDAANVLSFDSRTKSKGSSEHTINRCYDVFDQRVNAAFALDQEARHGGMFKRVPCLFLGVYPTEKSIQINCADGSLMEVWILKGGWQAVDQAIKLETEGRKFVERSSASASTTLDSTTNDRLSRTDEIVLRQLEYYAMMLDDNNTEGDEGHNDERRNLQLSVRAALKALGLPITPSGAKQALIQLGQWTETGQGRWKGSQLFEPWSKDVLNAAKYYMDIMQSQQLQNDLSRTDLRHLPCLCIDAPSTSFRDDALGIRMRSSTGRPVLQEQGGGKWELLIHITDVSDIYCPNPDVLSKSFSGTQRNMLRDSLQILHEAAAIRGMSRYDLLGGPLHLLPPTLLRVLSFRSNKSTEKNESSKTLCNGSGVCNQCVTLWVYLNESTGEILECGVERTLVSNNPIMITYGQATQILEGSRDGLFNELFSQNEKKFKTVQAMLQILNKSLEKWSFQHLETNEVAQKRAARLQAKQLLEDFEDTQNKERKRQPLSNRNKKFGRKNITFELSSGHKLVDTALNLYAYGVTTLLRQKKVPVPSASGASYTKRGARVGTAPLRRYIDGIIQRQVLAALCLGPSDQNGDKNAKTTRTGYGGKPLTRKECFAINERVARATNLLQQQQQQQGQ